MRVLISEGWTEEDIKTFVFFTQRHCSNLLEINGRRIHSSSTLSQMQCGIRCMSCLGSESWFIKAWGSNINKLIQTRVQPTSYSWVVYIGWHFHLNSLFMSVPEIHYISGMLALPSQFTSNYKCQGENPQQRVQKAAVLKLWVFLFCLYYQMLQQKFLWTDNIQRWTRSPQRQTLDFEFHNRDVLFRPFSYTLQSSTFNHIMAFSVGVTK